MCESYFMVYSSSYWLKQRTTFHHKTKLLTYLSNIRKLIFFLCRKRWTRWNKRWWSYLFKVNFLSRWKIFNVNSFINTSGRDGLLWICCGGGGEGWWRTLGRSHVFKGVLMGDQSSTTEYQGGNIAKWLSISCQGGVGVGNHKNITEPLGRTR